MEASLSSRSVRADDNVTVTGYKRELQRLAIKKLFKVVQDKKQRCLLKAFCRWHTLSQMPVPVAVLRNQCIPLRSTDASHSTNTTTAAISSTDAPSSGHQSKQAISPIKAPVIALKPRQPTRTSLAIGPTCVPVTKNMSALGLAHLLTGKSKVPILAAASPGFAFLSSPPSKAVAKGSSTPEGSSVLAGAKASIRGRIAAMDTVTRQHTDPRSPLQAAVAVVDRDSLPVSLTTDGASKSALLAEIRKNMAADAGRTPPKPNFSKVKSPSMTTIYNSTARAECPRVSDTNEHAKASERFEKYSKMLAVGVPAQAVRAKMVADGISPTKIKASGVLENQLANSAISVSAASGTVAQPGAVPAEKFAGLLAASLKSRLTTGCDGLAPQLAQHRDAANTSTATASAPSVDSAVFQGKAAPPSDDHLATYRKMLAVGVPRPAVAAKMRADGIDPASLDTSPVAAGNKTAPAENVKPVGDNLSCKDDTVPALAQYRKMLAVGVPPPAVAVKMRNSGISEADIDAFLNGSSLSGHAASNSSSVAAPIQTESDQSEHLRPYRKMLAVGVSAPAVAVKMRAAGLGDADIDAVMQHPKGNVPATPSEAIVPKADDPKLQPFKKMLSVGVPAAAVAMKMRAAGLDEVSIQVVTGSGASNPTATTAAVPRAQPMRAFSSPPKPGSASCTELPATKGAQPPKKLYWKEVPTAKMQESAFWSSLYADPSKLELPASIKADLVGLFGSSEPSTPVKKRDTSLPPVSFKSPGMASMGSTKSDSIAILDSRRSGNISIILSRFSAVSFTSLRAAVDQLALGSIPEDAVRGLLTLLPSSAERDLYQKFVHEAHPGKALNDLSGADVEGLAAKLARPDEWIFRALTAPRFVPRTKCMTLMMDLPSMAASVEVKATLLHDALSQVRSSAAFQELLRLALLVGNSLNGASDPSQRVWVKAFSLDSLAKLATVKASDKRTTALAIVVDAWYKGRPSQENEVDDNLSNELKAECSSVLKSSNIVLDVLEADVKMLRAAVRAVQLEQQQAQDYASRHEGDPHEQSYHMNSAGAYEKLYSKASRTVEHLDGVLKRCKTECQAVLDHYGADAAVYTSPELLLKDLQLFMQEVLSLDAELRAKKARSRAASKSREPVASSSRGSSARPPLAAAQLNKQIQ